MICCATTQGSFPKCYVHHHHQDGSGSVTPTPNRTSHTSTRNLEDFTFALSSSNSRVRLPGLRTIVTSLPSLDSIRGLLTSEPKQRWMQKNWNRTWTSSSLRWKPIAFKEWRSWLNHYCHGRSTQNPWDGLQLEHSSLLSSSIRASTTHLNQTRLDS